MAYNNFMDRIRSFFGLTQNPPRNDFRNPIWSSDDEDDGDELYTRQQIESFEDVVDLQQEFTKQMQDMLKTFGSMFGEFKSFFNEDHIDAFTSMSLQEDPESDKLPGQSIRDYYLKPGYHSYSQEQLKEDIDLDGKISSNDISGLLQHKKIPHASGSLIPFNGNMVPGRSFCKTIITTSITKPDGTVETKRIIKKGNEVIEETTTSTLGPHSQGPLYPQGLNQLTSSGFITNNIMSRLSSLFSNYD